MYIVFYLLPLYPYKRIGEILRIEFFQIINRFAESYVIYWNLVKLRQSNHYTSFSSTI